MQDLDVPAVAGRDHPAVRTAGQIGVGLDVQHHQTLSTANVGIAGDVADVHALYAEQLIGPSAPRRARTHHRVKSLVYVSALMPDVGESGMSLAARFPSALGGATKAVPYRAGGVSGTDLYLKPDRLRQVFAARAAGGHHEGHGGDIGPRQRPRYSPASLPPR
ncbi:hypothetical protein [Streptomyces sioyaensis]|uniref:hypothetical protein n=1 Tax=Streptomyces sioyaensis TaxID=67364 RepID=UPI00379ABE1B